MAAKVIHLGSNPTPSNSIQSFTSQKLDWLKCCCFDRRLQPYDFRVSYAIAQHINAETGSTMLSDQTIADETGGRTTRCVRRSRVRLRDAGWLTWKRTSSANVYRMKFDRFEEVRDFARELRELRRESRERQRKSPLLP